MPSPRRLDPDVPDWIAMFARLRSLGRVTFDVVGPNETRRSRLPVPLTSTVGRTAPSDFAVFAGPVAARDLPATIRTARPAETVARLVDRSLVFAVPGDDGVRFSALQTVRTYGRERLRTHGRFDEVHRRHATWFLDAVRQIDADLRTAAEPAATAR